MDTDISHAVEERLSAIETRLDALDGGPQEPEEQSGDEEPAPEPVVTSSRSRRSRSYATTSYADEASTTETTEGE